MRVLPIGPSAKDIHVSDSELIEVKIPSNFKGLCAAWAGGTDCMLRAIQSTGDLTLGSIRPYNSDVSRYLTDQEWHVSLWGSLGSDIRYNARLAEKSHSYDAPELRKFETFAEETEEMLRVAYGLQESEAV